MDGNKLSESMCYFLWDTINNANVELQDKPFSLKNSPVIHYISFVLSLLTSIIGIVGNAIVIYVTAFKIKEYKSKIWFLNLAVADFIFVLCLPLNAVAEFRDSWPFGSYLCKVYSFLSTSNNYASIFIITSLNIDRALSVIKPIWHLKFFSRRVCYWICVTIWTVTVLSSLPSLFLSDVYINADDDEAVCSMINVQYDNNNIPNITSEKNDYAMVYEDMDFDMIYTFNLTNAKGGFSGFPLYREQCKDNDCCASSEMVKIWNQLQIIAKYLLIPLTVIGCFIPLCVILLSNVMIALKVSKSQKVKPPRLYKIIVILVLVYLLTYTPTVVLNIILTKAIVDMNIALVFRIVVFFPFVESISNTNSCINPLIYSFVNKRIRNMIICSKNDKRKCLPISSHGVETEERILVDTKV
ncbi:N-formyl peptide receptor 3-like [Rhinophrynus dorsalis]